MKKVLLNVFRNKPYFTDELKRNHELGYFKNLLYIEEISEEDSDRLYQYFLDDDAVLERTVDDLEKEYIINPDNILIFGESNKHDVGLYRKIFIPIVDHENRKHYPCFHHHKVQPNPLVNFHEDWKSSWNCLMDKMSNPRFIVIYTQDEDSVS